MQETILHGWQDETWPTIKSSQSLPMGEGVIDQTAFNTIEIDKVFEATDYAATTVGQATLYRSLCQPLTDIKAIKAKQDAVSELRKNQKLKGQIEQLVENAAATEKNLHLLLFGEFIGAFNQSRSKNEIEGYGYRQYKNGVQFIQEFVCNVQAVEKSKSKYLNDLFNKVKSFTETRYWSLMEGPVYFVEGKITSKEERGDSYFPVPVIFKPQLFKPLLLALIFGLLWLISIFSPVNIAPSLRTVAVFFGPLLLLYFPIVGGYDRDNCIIPLRDEYKKAKPVAELLDVLGQLDELLSFMKFADNFGHNTVLPKFEDAKHHRIHLVSAVNPVLGKENPKYVGNDFVLDDDKLVLLTGPNSGGKTAFCKTVTQIQVMAQIGGYVPAKAATLTVADRIFYQVPEISHLDDGEGRFGTELKRTKDIFLATTAKSLVVLDELSEGTTFEEKMEASSNVLNGFYRKGNSTILITHNHQLVDQFAKAGTGVPMQVEFAKDAPTYHLVPGISRVSHADRVAKKIGFSKEDIDNYLANSK
ncbi:DNA mismatch repair protein MutS domain-containing protein [Methyloglobulus morosus KoM1]|uniref:DNA mismatch repair protein MutS domain-containing protein n=1 Tax=Methyloglobulus morosus KoM1 TaxID=1116472 RepID=V5C3Y2_9GAMM|nr:DNA mismatch repair protein MutS [Methyloglobulus morosus]ESS73152.1 DNA mismatch repair protein MutS domain-containing protein [Methyloglobulus morosus KoM1]